MSHIETCQAIGRRILEERKRLGLTQQVLADQVGVARYNFARYENGHSAPAAGTLVALDAVGMDVLYVLTGRRSCG